MSGNRIGGKRAAITNKAKHGDNFYAVIGAKGGAASNTGGFHDKELARRAGRLGGLKSRRGPAKPKFFVVDDKPFDEGFNKQTLWERIRNARTNN